MLVIKGLCRSQSFHKTKDKLPVMALVLHSIKLQLDLSKADDLMLWAAFCSPIFGFLRSFTVPDSGFDPEVHRSLADVSIDTHPIPSVVYLYVSHS